MSHKTLKTILGAVGFCIVTAAHAAYPERPITLVVTYPPGGTADRVARLVAPELAKELGQNVVVDNRGGAGGMIGAAYVAKAPADGYTIMLDAANHVQNPALRASMQFDTLKDFASVMLLQRVPNVLVANPGFAPKTVAELIALTNDAILEMGRLHDSSCPNRPGSGHIPALLAAHGGSDGARNLHHLHVAQARTQILRHSMRTGILQSSHAADEFDFLSAFRRFDRIDNGRGIDKIGPRQMFLEIIDK